VKPFLVRKTSSARPGRVRGQAMMEFVTLTTALLLGVGSILVFAPDMLAAFTLYVRGFYVILGYPLG